MPHRSDASAQAGSRYSTVPAGVSRHFAFILKWPCSTSGFLFFSCADTGTAIKQWSSPVTRSVNISPSRPTHLHRRGNCRPRRFSRWLLVRTVKCNAPVHSVCCIVPLVCRERELAIDEEAYPLGLLFAGDEGPEGEGYAWYACTIKGGRETRPLDAIGLARACEALVCICDTKLHYNYRQLRLTVGCHSVRRLLLLRHVYAGCG